MFFLAFLFEEFDETVFFFLPSVSSTRFSIIVFLTHTSKLNIQINFPASALPNRTSPIHFPKIKKPKVHREPKSRLPKIVSRMLFLMRSVSLRLSASEISGKTMTEIEFVSTVGKKMIESAIPVRMP